MGFKFKGWGCGVQGSGVGPNLKPFGVEGHKLIEEVSGPREEEVSGLTFMVDGSGVRV